MPAAVVGILEGDVEIVLGGLRGRCMTVVFESRSVLFVDPSDLDFLCVG